MLMIISPAKNLSSKPLIYVRKSDPPYLKEAGYLVSLMKKKGAEEISKMMKISSKLGDVNFERFQKWSYPFNGKDAGTALFMFQGEVYRGLQSQSFDAEDMDFAQAHLRILSGLYGILKPWDVILPYRLEAGTKLENDKGKDLYSFWGSTITKGLSKDIDAQGDRVLINLASTEYFKLIKPKELKADIYTPVFKEFKNGEYLQIAVYAKKARGLMVRFIVKNKLKQPDDLKAFNYEGYLYNDALSTKKEFVFTR